MPVQVARLARITDNPDQGMSLREGNHVRRFFCNLPIKIIIRSDIGPAPSTKAVQRRSNIAIAIMTIPISAVAILTNT
jgi:hypothetical protein